MLRLWERLRRLIDAVGVEAVRRDPRYARLRQAPGFLHARVSAGGRVLLSELADTRHRIEDALCGVERDGFGRGAVASLHIVSADVQVGQLPG